jgi:hypothetical protein
MAKIQVLCALAICSAVQAGATNRYVSPSGSDSAAGTQSQPWRTIQHAANTCAAGDTIYVRAGTYHEALTITRSGASSAATTFINYPNEHPIVDGTGVGISNGQQGLLTLQNVSNIIVQGFEIRNYKTSSTSSVPAGVFITGSGANIQILGNHIHHIENTAKSVNANAFGLAVYGTGSSASINHLTVSGNEVDHLVTGSSESVTFNGNVENFAVTNNLVHDNNNIGIDAIGFEGTSPTPSKDQARNGLIAGNVVYNITSYGNPAYGNQYAADGLYVDGGANIILERNLVYKCDLGIEVASEHAGHVSEQVTVRNNVVYESNACGISIGGYASSVGGTDQCIVVNNTLFENDTKNTGSGEFQIQYHATHNKFENNILYATEQGLFINDFTKSTSAPCTVDYNLYFSAVGADSGQWVWQSKTIMGYSDYQKTSHNDAHSTAFTDPKFTSIKSPPNFALQTGSPAIGIGSVLSSSVVGTVDFAGMPRVVNGKINLGAFEESQ